MLHLPLLLVLSATVPAEPAPNLPPTNIALGKPYELSPAPNYPLTTDAGDAVQLTDGKYAGGGFWTEKAAVGWSNARPISITIDLGRLQPISGVTFDTAAGRSDVEWPGGLYLYCSGDGRSFSYVGDLVALDKARGAPRSPGGFARRKYATSVLAEVCRFVRVMIDATGYYAFADEVEVLGGPDGPAQPARTGRPDGPELYWMAHAARRLRNVLDATVEAARARLDDGGIDAARRAPLLAVLDDIVLAAQSRRPEDWRPNGVRYPFDELHARALAAVGSAEQLAGEPPLRAWAASPWAPLSMTATPDIDRLPGISLALMKGEVRVGAINVRNSTGQAQQVRVEVSLAGTRAPDWIGASSVEWTGDAEARPVAAALRPLQVSPPESIDIPAGETRQAWLTFTSPPLAPGQYGGEVTITSSGGKVEKIPVTLQMLPGQMPATKRLHVGGWDYLNQSGVIRGPPDYLRRIAAMLREYGVDLPWATSGVMPMGRDDASGRMIEPPNTGELETWLALWPDATRYRVFIAAGETFAGHRLGTEVFREAVAGWARYWADQFRAAGVAPEKVELLFVDEPKEPKLAGRQVEWAGALQAARSGLRVWIDPTYDDVDEMPADLITTANTVCLNRGLVERSLEPNRALVRRLLTRGKGVELYTTGGPLTALDPYAYYRLQAWRAFDLGASAVSYWSFTDTGGGSSWMEYTAPRKVYAPLFLDGFRVAATKHLVAIYEGVQDYEYLAMLRDALMLVEGRRSPTDPMLLQARAVLAAAVASVVVNSRPETYGWSASKDRREADAARLRVAEALRLLAARESSSP